MANNTFTQNNQLQIAFKKLLGKAHTNPNFEFFNENFATSVQIANKNVFGQNIPSLTSTPANYTTSSNSAGEVTVETVPFTLTGIDASQYDAVEGSVSNTTIDDQTTDNSENSSQIHTFKLVLASDYVSTSNNPNSGSDPFTNSRIVADTTGALQIIPESFGVGYAPIVKDSSGNTIGALDNENYLLDPFNGILFVQDQDGGSNFKVPASVTASIYIGSYADAVSSLPDGVLSSSAQIASEISGAIGHATASIGDLVTDMASATSSISALVTSASLFALTSSIIGTANEVEVTANNPQGVQIGLPNDVIIGGSLTAQGDVIAQRYIVSSSITHMTQSFSSGSTIFGDTLDDTHQFTGSLSITGSSITSERTPLVITADGEVQIADEDFITSGDIGQYELDISSSGDNTGISITNTEVLIISGAGGLDVTSNTNTLTLTIGGGIVSGKTLYTPNFSEICKCR